MPESNPDFCSFACSAMVSRREKITFILRRIIKSNQRKLHISPQASSDRQLVKVMPYPDKILKNKPSRTTSGRVGNLFRWLQCLMDNFPRTQSIPRTLLFMKTGDSVQPFYDGGFSLPNAHAQGRQTVEGPLGGGCPPAHFV